MWETNPNLIEEPEPGTPEARAIPVVLMHDGGGTVFSYYCLAAPLGRPLYGIFNPNFHSGEPWRGGIPEMARHYVRLVRATVPRGPVILGGWSLGGLLALEMARVFAGDRYFTVAGIVMVDSVCPAAGKGVAARPSPTAAGFDAGGGGGRDSSSVEGAEEEEEKKRPPTVQAVASRHIFGERTKQETKDAVLRCFADATRSVGRWTLPEWAAAAPVPGAGRNSGGGGGVADRTQLPVPAPPPAILLRARESVPVDEGEGGITRVDLHRGDPRLGWDSYREGLFCRVVEVAGHHFNMFSDEHVGEVTSALNNACEVLERIHFGVDK